MRCVVPNCDNVSTEISQGIAYHTFPAEPSLRAAWLQALLMTDRELEERSAVCSSHFQREDLLLSSGGLRELRAGAVPILDVLVCRICFATDCKLYHVTTYKILSQTYEILTGLLLKSEDNLPKYLCLECARQLRNCARLRHTSIEAYSILTDIVKNQGYITLDLIQSAKGVQFPLSLDSIDQDLDIELAGKNIYTDEEDMENLPALSVEVVIDGIKTESDIDNVRDTNDTRCSKWRRDAVKDENSEMVDEAADIDVGEGKESLDVSRPKTRQKAKQSTTRVRVRKIYKKTRPKPDIHKSPEPENEGSAKLTCDLCPYQTSNESQLSTHVKAHAASVSYSCDTCNYITISKRNLTYHSRVHSGERPFSCDACRKSFYTQSDLNRHCQVHSTRFRQLKTQRPSSYACDVCSKAFALKCHLKRHLRAHSGNRPYSCEVCDKNFKQKSALKSHLWTHCDERPFLCDVCNKSFMDQSHLNTHLRIHSGERPYSCDFCDKVFRYKNNLTVHLRIHSGDKPYLCDVCNRTFNQKSALKSHLWTHSDERPYLCEVCNKSFTDKSYLKTHSRIHTGVKPYLCIVCNKAFNRQFNLTKHLRTHASVN